MHFSPSIQFDDVKMGDDQISNGQREKFEQWIDNFMQDLNETLILYNNCMDLYDNVMNKSIEEDMLYFNETDLIEYHLEAKNESLSKVSFDQKFSVFFGFFLTNISANMSVLLFSFEKSENSKF